MKIAVTTNLKPNAQVIARAHQVAADLALPFIERRKQSLGKLMAGYDGLLLVYAEKLVLVNEDASQLSFHPDTAMLRIKSKHDALLALLGEQSLSVLDTTMGLAGDSLVMAYGGHQVTALESQKVIHYLVSQGLQTFESSLPALNQAMSSIETHCQDSLAFLTAQPDKSFDVIYCDPMFSESISESDNLDGLKPLANYAKLSQEFLDQAKRVARKKIIIKAHFRDRVFEEFGFERHIRPNQKFHYGLIDLSALDERCE